MFHFDKSRILKRLPLAVLPALGAILFILFFQHYTGPDSSMLQRGIYVTIVMGGILSAIAVPFMGFWGFLPYGWMLALALPRLLPEPWNRYSVVVFLAVMLGGGPLINLLKKKAKPKSRAQKIRIALLTVTGLVCIPWWFLKVPYALFSWAAITLSLTAFALVCWKNTVFTLEEHPGNGWVNMQDTFVYPMLTIMVRTLIDFNIMDWPRLLSLSLIPMAVLQTLLLVRQESVRKSGIVLILNLLLLYAFSVGSMAQLNHLLDVREPELSSGIVQDMGIRSSRNGTYYDLVVDIRGGKLLELETSKDIYEALSIGEAVDVWTYHGSLGVPYVEATPE